MSQPATLTHGITIIARERQRHFDVEGWTPCHDDEHTNGELAQAAACYAWPPPRPLFVKGDAWPWRRDEWKPEIWGVPDATEQEKREARIRVLAKAGALIAAEIDRLARIDGAEITAPFPSLAREAAEEIAAIAAEDPARSRLLSTAFKQRVTDTIVSRFNCSSVTAAGGDEIPEWSQEHRDHPLDGPD